jgi:hypothetical protein
MRIIDPLSYLVNKALYRVAEMIFRFKKVLTRHRFLSKNRGLFNSQRKNVS